MAHIFISHHSKDKPFVLQLQESLEGLDQEVWLDAYELRAGDDLDDELLKAIEDAKHFILVLSDVTVNSEWVRWEVDKAREIQKTNENFRIVPILLPPLKPEAVKAWIPDEKLCVMIDPDKPGALGEAMPKIMVGLGEQLPDKPEEQPEIAAQPLDELLLKLSEPELEITEGKQRVSARAVVVHRPAEGRETESRAFQFT
ncbi:MAG: toll/interleukin-1 receptor domain-containing protein [Planctomycetota bacterium]|jgi:hypothetical protein|nr:toll/interleukin-1 receptor domain-containing protein [Planctomycetota bacterium]MDP7248517.1 toll/interleukin-1 receptor domain-containing protein [Planctomycetota bacterium]